jgi:hypothetical protein
VRDELSKPEASKRTIKVAAILVVVIVVVIAGAWLWSSNYFRGGQSATGDKIDIIGCDADCGPCTTCYVVVANVGSGVVEITAIYIGPDLYSYSASPSPGKFSATSNQIPPGQSMAFTVIKASGSWSPSAMYTVKVVTKNGAEASVSC